MAVIPEYSPKTSCYLDYDCAVSLWGAKNVQARRKKPAQSQLEVDIQHHFTAKVYTHGSPITGQVVITPEKDVSFESVRVSLIGMTRVRRQDGEVTYNASHVFLDVNMPISDSEYPPSRVFERGNTYRIPFYFIMPAHLPTSSCAHGVDGEITKDLHIRMPPTMGGWERNDMSSKMAGIEYSIRAWIKTSKGQTPLPREKVTGSIVINFWPLSPEEPPIEIPEHNTKYVLSISKPLRKTLLSISQGQISATTSQPRALMLRPNGGGTVESSLLIKLALELPRLNIALPESTLISAELLAETWYHGKPTQQLPHLSNVRVAYTKRFQILQRTRSEIAWVAPRRGEVSGSEATHMAELRVPLQFSSSKHILLPTFHSCLVSRTYLVQVSIQVDKTTLKLVVPVQVANDQANEQSLQHGELGSSDLAVPGYTESNSIEPMTRRLSMTKVFAEASLPVYSYGS